MKKFIVALMIFYLPVDAWAGQLHLHFVTLGEIALHGAAYLGTVVSVYAQKQTVVVKIKQKWLSDQRAISLDNHAASTNEDVQEFRIYTGIVWDNPNKSPVDHRIMGSLPINQIKPGQEVILLQNRGYEMLAADPSTLKKLDLFFSPSALEQYKNSAPARVLYADLNDHDLSEPALEAMCKRHLYAPSAFLAMEPYNMFNLSWKLGQCLPAQEFDAWLAAMVSETQNASMRLRLLDLARDSSLSAKVSTATRQALVKTLDLKDPDQQNALRWFIQIEIAEIAATPDIIRAEQAAEHALALAASRDDSASWEEYESLKKLAAILPSVKKTEFIKQIGHLIVTSNRAKKTKERFDDGLLNVFLELISLDPSIAYLPELADIDLSHIPKTSQNRVESRVAILNAGLVLAQKDPSSAGAVYRALKKWIQDETIFHPEIILSMDEEKPGDKQKKWLSTLKKFKALNR